MYLNKAFVLGNLTQEPQKNTLPSGMSVVNFGMATNRYYTDKQGQRQKQTEFHNIVLFGRLADIAAQYLNKGSMALIEGRLRTRNWDDKDGIRHWKTEIVGERMQLGPTSGFQARQGYQGPAPEPQQQQQKKRKKPQDTTEEDIPVIEEDKEEIDVKNLPF